MRLDVAQVATMNEEGFTDTVKARVKPSTRQKLESIAHVRELGVSDVLREAIRTYLKEHGSRRNGKKAEVAG